MALEKHATGHFPQLPTEAHESIYESISPEWKPMDDTDNDILDLTDIPEEVLFPDHVSKGVELAAPY